VETAGSVAQAAFSARGAAAGKAGEAIDAAAALRADATETSATNALTPKRAAPTAPAARRWMRSPWNSLLTLSRLALACLPLSRATPTTAAGVFEDRGLFGCHRAKAAEYFEHLYDHAAFARRMYGIWVLLKMAELDSKISDQNFMDTLKKKVATATTSENLINAWNSFGAVRGEKHVRGGDHAQAWLVRMRGAATGE